MTSVETSKYCKSLADPWNNTKDVKTKIFRSCLELLNDGYTKSGKYDIKPYLNVTKTVYCDQDTEGGGWTLFLRNAHGLITFDKKWVEYKKGFGNVEYDFWLGNEFLHNVTKLYNSHISKAVELYVIVADEDGGSYYAMYKNFAILSENTSYTLHVSQYFNGTMSDALTYHNNMKFSAKDKDNDNRPGNCIEEFHGFGWWYNSCYEAVLTYMVYDTANHRYRPAPRWQYIHNDPYRNLKNATMMFREKI